MDTLRILAPAKLNLFLHVTGKRPDLPTPERSRGQSDAFAKTGSGFAQAGGYHLLESLVAFTEFGDSLEITPAKTVTLDITGPFAGSLQPSSPFPPPTGGRPGGGHSCISEQASPHPSPPPAGEGDFENIVLKAARLLKAHAGCNAGAHIRLEKNIPVGAGLGGGSSDAAAALSGLKKLWRLDIDNAALQALALQLGSDVPVCLTRRTAWMQGIGERITPVDMRADVWALLVNPGIPIATKDVFGHFSEVFSLPSDAPGCIGSIRELMRLIAPKHNALEAAALTIAPVIGEVLATIGATRECLLSRMSGSGATCFGIYDDAAAAQKAAAEIQKQNPKWWSVIAKLVN